ncbi:single-strand binding protein [Aureibacillus halotolerans]|uniref:Single-stranded DNA-binding protein n=1 Tax=Aureibacillus halotolerans TaxID=1508390 RepID=A0A4R6TZ70_9BACI|nr:single-stranded DNA-binding protein [Aureibacillus halotolerans]TDQ36094.1 single-strand binding protein [Aureibacillus halotolerans]
MNQILLIGRMTRSPELRYTSSDGVAVANFTLAVNRPFKNNKGEYDADFMSCTAWRTLAETTAEFCTKGSLVAVTGRLQNDSYENEEGKKVFQLEIIANSVQFLEPKNYRKKNEEVKKVVS